MPAFYGIEMISKYKEDVNFTPVVERERPKNNTGLLNTKKLPFGQSFNVTPRE